MADRSIYYSNAPPVLYHTLHLFTSPLYTANFDPYATDFLVLVSVALFSVKLAKKPYLKCYSPL